jgi:hypothetical protein
MAVAIVAAAVACPWADRPSVLVATLVAGLVLAISNLGPDEED